MEHPFIVRMVWLIVFLSISSNLISGEFFKPDFSIPNANGVMIHYALLANENEVVVTFKHQGEYRGEISIPRTVAYKGKEYVVTAIGRNAFRNCHSLRKVLLPMGLKAIEDESFANCVQLEWVHIPNSLKRIGRRVFFNCKKLEWIKLPSVATQSHDSFEGCEAEIIYPCTVRPPLPALP